MEALYLKGQSVEWATDKILLKKYFDEFSSITKSSYNLDKPTPANIASLMGLTLTDDQLNSLAENCSPDLLEIVGESPVVDVDKQYNNPHTFDRCGIPLDVELETFKRLKARTKLEEDYIFSRLKYKNQINLNEESKRNFKPNINPGEEFVITVRVFFPFQSSLGEEGSRKQATCSQEIMLLGNETLTELRDVIICMEEYGDVAGDVSECPSAPIKFRLKDIYGSGMFYIGNTFYIDRRHSDNIDYSEVIRSWAAKRKLVMNNVEEMENTKIKNLVVRFGYPYVYQHLANCEHLIVFSDARLIHENDVCAREQYPLYMTLAMNQAKYCYICYNNVARWIVVGSERVTRDVSFVCSSCFKLYFYKGKKKNGSFEAYHYFDRRSIV